MFRRNAHRPTDHPSGKFPYIRRVIGGVRFGGVKPLRRRAFFRFRQAATDHAFFMGRLQVSSTGISSIFSPDQLHIIPPRTILKAPSPHPFLSLNPEDGVILLLTPILKIQE